jgi:uncharacterized coiled-coil protein SlyX
VDTETRFIELETRYAHVERQVAELSEVVFEQQRSLGHVATPDLFVVEDDA